MRGRLSTFTHIKVQQFRLSLHFPGRLARTTRVTHRLTRILSQRRRASTIIRRLLRRQLSHRISTISARSVRIRSHLHISIRTFQIMRRTRRSIAVRRQREGGKVNRRHASSKSINGLQVIHITLHRRSTPPSPADDPYISII